MQVANGHLTVPCCSDPIRTRNNVFPPTKDGKQKPTQKPALQQLHLCSCMQLARPRPDFSTAGGASGSADVCSCRAASTALLLHVLQRWGGRRQRRTGARVLLLQDRTRVFGSLRERERGRWEARWCNRSVECGQAWQGVALVASDMKGESGEGGPGGEQQQPSNFARGPANSTYRSLRSLTAFPKKSATAASVSHPPKPKMASLTWTKDN